MSFKVSNNPADILEVIGKIALRNFNRFLKKYQDRHPEIRAASGFLENNPDVKSDPWINIADSLIHSSVIDKVEVMVEKLDTLLTKWSSDSNLPEFEFFDAIRSKPTELKKLIAEFKEELDKKNLRTQFLDYQDKLNLKRKGWVRDIIQSTTPFRIGSDPIRIIDGKVGIDWSILIEEYMRCTELMMRFIVEPILNSKNVTAAGYGSKLQEFFKGDTKLQFIVFDEILKPWLRHAIAHQQYYFEFDQNKIISTIVFYGDEKIDYSKEHRLTLDELSVIVSKLTLFFWTFLYVAASHLPDDAELAKLSKDPIVSALKEKEYYHVLNGLDILRNNVNVVGKSYQHYLAAHQHGYQIPVPFKHSYLLLRLMISHQINKIDKVDLYGSLFRISYLVMYSIVEEKLFYSLYHALNPNKPSKKFSGEELVKLMTDFSDGKFVDLIRDFDFENRNAIAHFTYFQSDNFGLNYEFVAKNGLKKSVKVMSGDLIHVMNYLDGIYDFDLKQQTENIGISLVLEELVNTRIVNIKRGIENSKIIFRKPKHRYLASLYRLLIAFEMVYQNTKKDVVADQISEVWDYFKTKKTAFIVIDYSILLIRAHPRIVQTNVQEDLKSYKRVRITFLSILLSLVEEEYFSMRPRKRFYLLNQILAYLNNDFSQVQHWEDLVNN